MGELYLYEDTITSTAIVSFACLFLLEVFISYRVLRYRLHKEKPLRPLIYFLGLSNLLLIGFGLIANEFPVDSIRREVPRWYLLSYSITTSIVIFNAFAALTLLVYSILKLYLKIKAKRAKKRKAKKELKEAKQRYRKRK